MLRSMEPFLSVVVPTYKRQTLLHKTLEGLAKQTLTTDAFEVLVVNDGSPDGTKAYLDGRVGTLPYTLRPIHLTNGGPGRARNTGIREAQGKVIVFLDDDIEPSPECLEVHFKLHQGLEPLVVIGPQRRDIKLGRTEPLWIRWEHQMLEKQYAQFASGAWTEAGPNHFYTGNASVRRDLLLAVGGFDEGFTRQEDVELAARLWKQENVVFKVELAANAVHRPDRTFESWLKTPYAYGSLDVVRAQRRDTSWRTIQHAFVARNSLTRLCIKLAVGRPKVGALLQATLKGIALLVDALFGLMGQKLGIALLSVIYNVRYMEGAANQLGDVRSLWEQITRAKDA
jgi:glycosyltransferase involved in cell wall biosynthesis